MPFDSSFYCISLLSRLRLDLSTVSPKNNIEQGSKEREENSWMEERSARCTGLSPHVLWVAE